MHIYRGRSDVRVQLVCPRQYAFKSRQSFNPSFGLGNIHIRKFKEIIVGHLTPNRTLACIGLAQLQHSRFSIKSP